MVYKISLQDAAITDMQVAFEWYEEQKSGLGHSFLDEVDICFEKLCKHPLQYGSINNWVRKIKVNRFPFLVVFEIDNDTVIVNTVLHTSRQPKY